MQRKSTSLLWIGLGFGVALAIAAAVVVVFGADGRSIRLALRLTARWSFLLFWMAYAGGAMAALSRPAFGLLARRGRDLGLAFAAAHLVHIGLVVWLYRISDRAPLSGSLFVFFAIGIAWIYLLATLSFGGLAQKLGPRLWRLVRILGMNYILLAFARDFVPPAIHLNSADQEVGRLLAYLPFAAMSIAAPLLCFAAAAQRRWGMRQVAA